MPLTFKAITDFKSFFTADEMNKEQFFRHFKMM